MLMINKKNRLVMDDKVFTFKSMFVGLSLIEATVYLFVILRKSRMKHTYMDYNQHSPILHNVCFYLG